jgi:hypothetical protein
MAKLPFLIFFLFHFVSASTSSAQQSDSRSHTLYLIGDAGEPIIEGSPLGTALSAMIRAETTPATVLFLGDNVYPKGVSSSPGPKRDQEEKTLTIQASWIKDLQAKGIFIPGNHDWEKGRRGGLERIVNQQNFIDSLNLENITFFPRDGCPGPVEIPLTRNVILVIIDSQWLLHPWAKPFGEESLCDAKTGVELASLLNDIYLRHEGKRVVLAAHHPLMTYGEHGGVFTLKDHIFPLTDLKPELYVPLPIIGSLYPLYRKWFGNVQDLAHPLYKFYSSSMLDLIDDYPGSIHVAGHEHALEYMVKDSTHLIVSGSGAKITPVKRKGYAQYAESVNGFVKISFDEGGNAEIQFIKVNAVTPNGVVTHSVKLPPVPTLPGQADSSALNFSGDVVTVKASDQYQATPWRKKMLGENYRAEWSQLVDVPLFDIGAEQGGLEIVKKGGGMQTLSLRLEDSTGHEYTLRSVEKFPEAAVPEMLRKTFAQDLVQDQISASHPYGALIVPPMAEAVGVYHANPRLVYVPDDPRLGIYRKLFANTLALFEERPDGDWSENAHFGNSDDIINTSKVISKLQKDNEDEVDQRFVLRARLFDMVIGDWDRHDDQWRWATIDGKKGKDVFRPIPRDRDQAFFVNEGILPKFWSRRWALPKFEGFDDEIRWPSGFSFNARYFDRTFLTEMTREDWVEEAKNIQSRLTDQVVEEAVARWPDEIYKLNGGKVIRKLKGRRDRLVDYAVSHYEFLAREVDVVASDKKEVFDVERLPSGDVEVKVFSLNKQGERDEKIYERNFKFGETDEVRLYGLGGEDQFNVGGTSRRSILVRIIGGGDTDQLSDSSRVRGSGKKTQFYDTKEGTTIHSVKEARDRTSTHPAVNEYNRKAFQYDRLAPLVFGNFNVDDGLFIGGGFVYQNNGFRKDPFKQRHIVLASIAPRTSSYNFLYRGDFTEVVGRWDVEINADLKVPNFVNNFFGWGNESVFDQEIDEQPSIRADDAIDYYRYRFEEIRLEAYLSRRIGSIARFRIGPALQRIEIEEPGDEDRYVYDYAETLPYDLFTEFNSFTGVRWQLQLLKSDNPTVIRRGVRWNINGSSMKGIDEGSQDFNSFESDLSLYYTFQFPGRLTFAVRTGGGINTGRYEFYQAQVLDGKTELRGFRKTRFYGDSKFYTNMEFRLKLSSFHTYMFPVSFGILGFRDIGRVWYKDENGIDPTAPSGKSDVWHKSWGGGFWFTPFNMAVLSTEIAHSDEGNLFYIRLGFLF